MMPRTTATWKCMNKAVFTYELDDGYLRVGMERQEKGQKGHNYRPFQKRKPKKNQSHKTV